MDQLLALLHLEDFRKRYPKDLSGGMRQRVAIARVLALDALTRRNLQDELLRLWTALKKTLLFVTHSIEESLYLADRTVLLTYRPGTIKRDFRITLPRPRDVLSSEFNALKKELSQLIMEEQTRHNQDEFRGAAVD